MHHGSGELNLAGRLNSTLWIDGTLESRNFENNDKNEDGELLILDFSSLKWSISKSPVGKFKII
jgi:hypothetical protein